MSNTKNSDPLLGAVLVTGGCGFFGWHLVRHLLDDDECGPVYVLDRCINEQNVHDEARYICGSITDAETVGSVIEKVKPRVIFHAASPNVTFPTHGAGDMHNTNVKGTELLLAAAAISESVRALVYTSTLDIYADPPHNNVDETHPRWMPGAKTSEYNLTKTMADRLVRASNGPGLRTATIVPAHMYGVRDAHALPLVLDTIAGNKPLVQVGRGENLMEVVSGDNAAVAHILLAKALLDPIRARGGKVDGESFNVSDGAPVPFWHHIRQIWKGARGEKGMEHIIVIPVWAMMLLVYVVEWALWIFTLDLVKPPRALSRSALTYTTQTHTYSIDKARRILGFQPIARHDEVLAEAVSWEITRRHGVRT